jgi:hypothetical protein
MLIPILGLLAVLSVPLAGGRLSRLFDLELRHPWLLFGGLLIQVVIISVIPGGGDDWVHRSLHLSTYGFAFLWLAMNSSVPWRWAVFAGGLSNFTVIAANRGLMPASPAALKTAGNAATHGFDNSTTAAHAIVGFLGDVFAIPASVPLANVFSVGDVLIVVGLFLIVHRQCESYVAYLLARVGDAVLRRHPVRRPVHLLTAR